MNKYTEISMSDAMKKAAQEGGGRLHDRAGHP